MPVEFVEFPDEIIAFLGIDSLADCPLAGSTLREHQQRVLVHADRQVFVRNSAWIDPSDLAEALKTGKALADNGLTLLAFNEHELHTGEGKQTAASFNLVYPWDLLKLNELLVGALKSSQIAGSVHPAAHIEGHVILGEGSRILPGVFIEGNVIFGKNCKIGPNCYIRGNTSIGDNCHIGQSVEIKNCLIMNKTNVGHLSYVGDSVLANQVNFGAGTTTSNLRHDNGNHKSMIYGQLIDTGRRKFGVIVGSGVHTGINTSFYPGRKMAPKTTTLPGEVVKHDKQ